MAAPQQMLTAEALIEQNHAFLAWLVEWEQGLPALRWADLVAQIPPERIGVFCVDMNNGFCHAGNLASPRVHALIPAVRRLFEEAHRGGVRQFVLPQDTHRCVHQLTMHLRLRSNARNQPLRVIVPANAVQTYDLPVETARAVGALPHPGDFLHLLFLYHLRLNGVEVVSEIA